MSLGRITLGTNKNSSQFLLTNTFLMWGCFLWSRPLFLFSYLWRSYHFRTETVVYVIHCGGAWGEIRERGMSEFLSLIGSAGSFKKKYFRKYVNFKSKWSLQCQQTISSFAYSTKCHFRMNTALRTWLHLHTRGHTHGETDTHALFLQDPADAAETVESVSLVNKQWEAAGSLHWASKL